MAVVLNASKDKTRIIYINEAIQNTVNTSTHISKTPPNTHTHTLQNKLKQPQYKIHTKRNSHSSIRYPQYKVILMYRVLLSPKTSHSDDRDSISGLPGYECAKRTEMNWIVCKQFSCTIAMAIIGVLHAQPWVVTINWSSRASLIWNSCSFPTFHE